MSSCTSFEVIDNIGILTLCRPPVNTSDEPCMFFKTMIELPGEHEE